VIDAAPAPGWRTSALESSGRPAGRGRDPTSIRLVAVSKTFPSIRDAADAGQIDFGEK
jgi:uncharacterized pyridoxal phosphate-containing UPF0001 family protein